jgi:hypothetical protein
MKTEAFDHFHSGLLLLIMLTLAVVAGQAQPSTEVPQTAENTFEMNAGFRITIDHKRLGKLESVLTVIETVLQLPIKVEFIMDDFATSDIVDPDTAAVQ